MRYFINKTKLFAVVITLGIGSSAFSVGWDINDLAKPCEALQEHDKYWKDQGKHPLVGDPIKTLVLATACLTKLGSEAAFLKQFGSTGSDILQKMGITK